MFFLQNLAPIIFTIKNFSDWVAPNVVSQSGNKNYISFLIHLPVIQIPVVCYAITSGKY